MFQGLRTVIYPAPDLDAAKEWWSSVLGQQPYFDEPFYVGFNVGGYELGLNPDADPEDGPVTYWGVPKIEDAMGVLMGGGAQPHSDISDVGDGVKVATVLSPTGHLVGVIENPHFKLPG
ncbi:MAG TPA: VOC family protein [Actinomycetota bacterium]|nr:VOC family protein [Actinomycetota bacterium]